MKIPMVVALALAAAGLLQQPAPPAPAPVDAARVAAAASAWTTRFERSLSGLLFRERYVQKYMQGGSSRQTHLEANIFLLKASPTEPFVLYRDVYQADGRAVKSHTKRLQEILTTSAPSWMSEARRLTEASARYNAGFGRRTVNVPTMPLEYLAPARVAGLAFKDSGEAPVTVGGLDVVVIEFTETARPTLVRGAGRRDLPARGRYWIHAASGAVVRAFVEFVGRGHVEVEYALHETLGVWVPVKMTDVISGVTGVAEYDEFQRVVVSTKDAIK